jgi:1-pyrroline-5-carboxylate dehydrogenase
MLSTFRCMRWMSSLPKWATVDPVKLSGSNPHTVVNILDGKSVTTGLTTKVVDPMNGESFLANSMADQALEQKFIDSQRSIPRWGLHNPIRNVGRYVMYGDVFFRIAAELRKK